MCVCRNVGAEARIELLKLGQLLQSERATKQPQSVLRVLGLSRRDTNLSDDEDGRPSVVGTSLCSESDYDAVVNKTARRAARKETEHKHLEAYLQKYVCMCVRVFFCVSNFVFPCL